MRLALCMTRSEKQTPPSAGTTSIRVRYVECDPMGVAHHSSYLPWMEMGRTELLREVGESYAALEQAGVFLVVTKLEVKYRRPIRYDDVIEIRTRVAGSTKVKLMHSYELVLVERAGVAPNPAEDPSVPTDGVCAIATTEIACVGSDGRPRAMPEWLS
jgi:acyl-CoA thioester hydrolase